MAAMAIDISNRKMAVSFSSLPHLGGKTQTNSGSEKFLLCSLRMGTKDIMEGFVHRILNSDTEN